MSERGAADRVNRAFAVGLIAVGVAAVAGGLLYWAFGDKLVEAMYEGRSLEVLNNLIKHQDRKGVEHYQALADRVFLKLWLVGVVGGCLVVVARRLVFANPKLQASSAYSLAQMKVILLAALGIRLVLLPWFRDLPLAGDESYYWGMAKWLVMGEYGWTVVRPPLWGYVLVIPRLLYGDPLSARLVAAVVGACTAVLVYLVACRVFDKRAGLAAGLIYAVFPEHVCYSHYLWSEILLSLLVVLSVYLFVLFAKNTEKGVYLLGSFLAAGLALLAKEFAVVLFAGLAAATVYLRVKRPVRKLLVGSLLFALPAAGYSAAISAATGEVTVLCNAPANNLRIATGLMPLALDGDYPDPNEIEGSILSALAQRSLPETASHFRAQFYNLWTPNSFPIVRVMDEFQPAKWSYGISIRDPWVVVLAGGYVLVTALGVVGMCWARRDAFKVLSMVSLVCLSLTGVPALLCSRFRLAFMFIFVIYAGYLLASTSRGKAEARSIKRWVPAGILLLLLAHVIYVKAGTLGWWG